MTDTARAVPLGPEALAFVAEATRRLARSVDYAETVRAVAGVGVPRLGDQCALDLLDDGGTAERVAAAGPAGGPLGRAGAAVTIAEVLRTGRTVFVSAPRGESGIDGASSPLVSAPVRGRDGVLGALTFGVSSPGRSYTAEDLALAEELAGRAALAIENARLFRRVDEARRRAEAAQTEMAVLYRLVDAVSRAEAQADVYEPALDAVRDGLGVDRSSILLFDADGVMRFAAWRGLSDAYRAAVEGHSPWRRDTRDPRPILVADVAADPGLAAFMPVFEAEGIRALGFVPIAHHGELLGKFMIYSGTPRGFSPDEVRLATTIGAQVAQAVARKRAEAEIARLLEDAEAARHSAEAAARGREHVLAIVSHDLRNPLFAATTSAEMLLRIADESGDERVRKYAETVHRSGRRMDRLISDLLDAASLEAGVLSIDVAPVDASVAIDQALELLAPMAATRQQTITVSPPAGRRPVVLADRERLAQVFWNLVGNAIKFTPPGGSIEIGYTPVDRFVRYFVRDTGGGISPEALPRVFDRYWQAQRPGRQGVGLGLAIARGLVEAHGGRIWVDSGPGRGATFYFTVPAATENRSA